MQRKFPTFRAWRGSLNRNVHLGRAVLAFYASGILLLLPLCFAASKLRNLRLDLTNSLSSSQVDASTPDDGLAFAFPDDLAPLLAFGAAGLVAIAFAGWSIGRGLLSSRREVALLRDGTPTVGTIVSVDRKAGIVEYRYSAVVAAGEGLRTFAATQTMLHRLKRIEAGTSVRVVYDPDEQEASVLDLDSIRDDGAKKAKPSAEPTLPINRS